MLDPIPGGAEPLRDTESFSADQLECVMYVFRRVLDAEDYEVIWSGEPVEGIGGREIAPDPLQGVFIRARRQDRRDLGEDNYSIRVRNVGWEASGERWFDIDAYGDFMGGESLELRVSLSSDGNAIDATLRLAFQMLDRWNLGEV